MSARLSQSDELRLIRNLLQTILQKQVEIEQRLARMEQTTLQARLLERQRRKENGLPN